MSNYIRQIQADLKEEGFYTGEIDGIAGELTVKAVADALEHGKTTEVVQRAVKEMNKSDPAIKEKQVQATKLKHDFFLFAGVSVRRLEEIDQKLANVTRLARKYSKQEFEVLEGLRTRKRQEELVRKGASQTMNSKHLIGHAVDLVPIVNGKISWDWKYYYPIADVMRQAAQELDVKIRWGGAWQVLNDTTKPTVKLVEEYVANKKKQGRKAFTDGPHFELA